ncbi:MAG TPA: methyltransferase [Aliidongia sp.]|nr:methyltransferase [Aliidongia sp.]
MTPERLMQLAWGYAPPLVIEAAVRNGVFDALARGARTVAELAAETGASERGLTAISDALVGLGLLEKDGSARYRLAPESAAFLVKDKPGYLGSFFRHISTQLIPDWLHLTETVRTGAPPVTVNEEATGSPFFQEFVESLFGINYAAAKLLGEHLGLGGASAPVRVLDLAAGSGVWGIALAEQSPHVAVTAVDWPGVLATTRRVVERHGLTRQYSFVAGDLLQAAFGTGHQIATLGHILHTEGEARSRELLRRTFDALAPGGTIAIGEFLVSQDRTGPPHCLLFAVNMLLHSSAGNAYSFEEIGAWLSEAGFTDIRTLEAPAPSPLILASRPA